MGLNRTYAPDYVSAETLAYRLDCSRSTIDNYVKLGLLPKPENVGNLLRWDFAQVKTFIKESNMTSRANRHTSVDDDEYLKGIQRGTPSQSKG